MCRLYAFRSTEPTKVECTLVLAQNALLTQSRGDEHGEEHANGWGVGAYVDTRPRVERQAWAAYQGEHFRQAAARVYSRTVLAHVRSATMGEPRLENTHPFDFGTWLFAHNGTIDAFPRLRDKLLHHMTPAHRAAVRGDTDSEHFFHLLLSMLEAEPHAEPLDLLRAGIRRVIQWSGQLDPAAETSLTVIWTDGLRMVGARRGRTLWYVEREGITNCEICGFPHVLHDPKTPYRAVDIASEPITHETWRQVPDDSVFRVNEQMHLHIEPL